MDDLLFNDDGEVDEDFDCEEFLLGGNDSNEKAEFMVRNRTALDRLKSIRLSF